MIDKFGILFMTLTAMVKIKKVSERKHYGYIGKKPSLLFELASSIKLNTSCSAVI